jgi:hypothetical protein
VLCVQPALIALAGVLFVASCGPVENPPLDGGPAPLPPAVEAPVERSTARLDVVVTAREDGLAVAGVAVTVAGVLRDERRLDEAFLDAAAEAITDANGLAAFELAPGAYDVSLASTAAEAARVNLGAATVQRHELRIPTRAALDVQLSIVADEDGSALAGASVRVSGVPAHSRGALVDARSNAGGTASVRVPAWTETVASITAPGRGEARVALPLASEIGPVRLVRNAELRGRLTTVVGAPVARVEIAARAAATELFAVEAWPRGPRQSGREL